MKKTYISLLMIAMAFVMLSTGCKNAKKEADNQITNAVKATTVPQELKEGYILKEISYEDKVLTYEVEIPKNDLKNLKEGEAKENTLKHLKDEGFSRKLIDNLVMAGASVHYILKSPTGADYVDYTFTPEELGDSISK